MGKRSFRWDEVHLNDEVFTSDPRPGCMPAYYNAVGQGSQPVNQNYGFYLVLNGQQPGIYKNWSYAKQMIDTETDRYRGFDDRQVMLKTYRWYCLYYHHHEDENEYYSFSDPFPPGSQLRLPVSLPSTPSSASRKPASKAREVSYDTSPLALFKTGKGKETKQDVQASKYFVVRTEMTSVSCADWNRAEREYKNALTSGQSPVVLLAADDFEVAQNFARSGVVDFGVKKGSSLLLDEW